MPGLSEIEAVLAVARHGSFRSAAVALGLSRSALSHAIATFERRLGVRLFHRTTRSVALTDAGRRFVEGVSDPFDAIVARIDDVSATRRELRGTLRLNTFPSAAGWLMPSLFLEYMRRHPGVHLDIVTDGRLIDIVKEGFDAGIRLSHTVPLDMIAIDLGHDVAFTLCASPAYLAARGTPHHPRDLSGHQCIRNRMPSGKAAPWTFERDGETIKLCYEGPVTLDDVHLILEAARAGVGLACVPEADAASFIAGGSLRPVLSDWMPTPVGLRLYYPGRRHVPAALRAMIDLVKGHSWCGAALPVPHLDGGMAIDVRS